MTTTPKPRFAAFADKSVLLLVATGAAVLALADWRMLLALLTWTAFAAVLGGVTILISRITFPAIRLTDLIERAKAGDMPAAVMVAALLLYVGLLFLGVATWAK